MIFALVVYAKREDRTKGVLTCAAAMTKNARSKEEAVGIAHAMAHEAYPVSEGYEQHGGNALQIPDDWIMEAAEELVLTEMAMRGMSGNDYGESDGS